MSKSNHIKLFPEPSEVLAAKADENEELWEPLSFQVPIYESIYYAYSKVVSALMGSRDTEASNPTFWVNSLDEDLLERMCWNRLQALSPSFKIGKNTIELDVSLDDIEVPITWNPKGDASLELAASDIEVSIKSLFPKFQYPTGWSTVNGNRVMTGGDLNNRLNSATILKSTFLEHSPATNNDIEPVLASEINYYDNKMIRSVGHLELNAINAQFVITDGKDQLQADTGLFKGLTRPITAILLISARAKLVFPKAYAHWVTSAEGDKDFNPSMFYDYTGQGAKFAIKDGSDETPNRVGPLSVVIKDSVDRLASINYTPKPRVNKDGFSILKSNEIFFFSPDSNVSEYESILRSSYDAGKQEVVNVSKIPKLKDMLIYTDWDFNRLTFTTDKGKLKIYDIGGCIPLDDVTIAQSLKMKSNDDKMISFLSYISNMATEHNLYKDSLSAADIHYSSVSSMVSRVYTAHGSFTMANLSGETITPNGTESNKEDAYLRDIKRIIKEAFVLHNMNNDMSIPVDYGFLRYMFALVLNYGNNHRKYKEILATAIEDNKALTVVDPDYTIDLPNLPGLTSLLNHQGSIVATLDKSPKNAIQDVAPGGGKAPMQIVDAVLLLSKAKTKRCAICMPTNLVPQFATEITEFSKGELNVVPITQKVMDTMSSLFEDFNSTAFVEWIKSMPINTLFVVSTDFIKGKRDIDTGKSAVTILYGSEEITQWPNAELLIRCEFDYISVDESHLMSNLESQRSMALGNIMAAAEYKRVASGTLVNNLTTDLVGQTALLNPRILGSKLSFMDEFALDHDGDKMTVSNKDANPIIRERIKPYSSLITKRRRDWAWALPKPIESLIPVELDEFQQSFYQDMVQEAYAKILADPKLSKMLKSSSEDDVKAIENALKLYFAKVEIFLNAPDSNQAFAGSDVPEESMVSPKAVAINKIIGLHFNGGNYDANISFKKSDSKIIIFGYNKAVTKHLYNHSMYKKEAVYYSAGNIEALTAFKEDDRVKIMYADETSINTGFNFQQASLLIRVQSLWSPGDQDQALSRIFRPDPKADKMRDNVHIVWLLTEQTLELGKAGRLFSKILDKARFDEVDNKDWKEIEEDLSDLPLLSMNLKTLEQFKTIESLHEYYSAYATYKAWEDRQFQKSKDKMQAILSKKLGRHVEYSELAKLSTYDVVNIGNMQGSVSNVYVPFVPGLKIQDKHNIGLSSIAVSDSEGDPESSDYEEQRVKKGELVYTELGVGSITSISKGTVGVKFPNGMTKRFSKFTVFIPNKEHREKNTLKVLARNMLPSNIPTINAKDLEPEPLPTAVTKEPKRSEAPNKSLEKDNQLWVYAIIINGKIALTIDKEDGDISAAISRNWRFMDEYWATHISTYKGMERVIDALKPNFKISPDRLQGMLLMAKNLKTKKGRLEQVKTDPKFLANVKNFFLMQHRRVPIAKPGEKPILRAMSMIWEGEVYIAWNKSKHSPKTTAKVKRLLKAKPGVGAVSLNNASAIKFFKTKSSAVKELKALSKIVSIPTLGETLDDLDQIIVKSGFVVE